jgi:nucleoside-diphosphate-sugar epimerase
LISTTGVYGDCKGAWIDESTPLNPTADRAFRRADAEQQVQQFCQQLNIPLVILRVAGIYGPGKIPLARIKSRQPIVNKQDSPIASMLMTW